MATRISLLVILMTLLMACATTSGVAGGQTVTQTVLSAEASDDGDETDPHDERSLAASVDGERAEPASEQWPGGGAGLPTSARPDICWPLTPDDPNAPGARLVPAPTRGGADLN